MAFMARHRALVGDQHAYSHLYRPIVLVSVCVNLDMDKLSWSGCGN
jgi:hypothetical protein